MPRKRMIVPIFIPHQGCPYRCVFCDQVEISGSTEKKDQARLDSAFELYLRSQPFAELPPWREAAFYGGTFTSLPARRQLFFLQRVQAWVDEGWIHAIRLSTHPSSVDEAALEVLSGYSVETIELGVQSTDASVLKQSGRDDTVDSLACAVDRIRQKGYSLGMQLMAGLPGDTERTFFRTVEDAVGFQPDFVRIYPALVIRGTKLDEMYQKGEFVPWNLEQTVTALTHAVRKFEEAGIPVIRLGLHPEPSLLENFVAGPIHPSLRSLVDSRLAYSRLSGLLTGLQVIPGRVLFRVPERQLSSYKGYLRENYLKLKENFSIKEVMFRGEPDRRAPELCL